jgi:hypothetical protein
MFESFIPKEKYSRLEIDVKERNLLHVEIMKLMLTEFNNDTELKWVKENGSRVSAIIDNTDNVDLRELILSGDKERAAQLIKYLLVKEDRDYKIKKAA